MFRLSDSAYRQIRYLLEKQGRENWGLSISVHRDRSGGAKFTLNFSESPKKEDRVVKWKDIRCWIDPQSCEFLSNYVLDFADGMFGGGFRLIDSTAGKTCRCGKPIAV